MPSAAEQNRISGRIDTAASIAEVGWTGPVGKKQPALYPDENGSMPFKPLPQVRIPKQTLQALRRLPKYARVLPHHASLVDKHHAIRLDDAVSRLNNSGSAPDAWMDGASPLPVRELVFLARLTGSGRMLTFVGPPYLVSAEESLTLSACGGRASSGPCGMGYAAGAVFGRRHMGRAVGDTGR